MEPPLTTPHTIPSRKSIHFGWSIAARHTLISEFEKSRVYESLMVLAVCLRMADALVMTAYVSSPAISRFASAVPMSYSGISRLTRPLVEVGRWPSRSEPLMRSSSLASLLHVQVGRSVPDALLNDDRLRGCVYLSSWPSQPEQEPALGAGRWGEVLERLIETVTPLRNYVPVDVQDTGRDHYAPHQIELSLNPLSIVLTWLGADGAPVRRDYYGPNRETRIAMALPYGEASLLVNRTTVSIEFIALLSEILWDSTQPTSSLPAVAGAEESKTAESRPGETTALRSDPSANENALDGVGQHQSRDRDGDDQPFPRSHSGRSSKRHTEPEHV